MKLFTFIVYSICFAMLTWNANEAFHKGGANILVGIMAIAGIIMIAFFTYDLLTDGWPWIGTPFNNEDYE